MMIRPIHTLKIFLILSSVLIISGCGGGMSDLRKFAEQAKTTPPTQAVTPPKMTLPSPYAYQAYQYRSPFDNLQQQQTTSKSGPLSRYPLYTLKLIGTIARGNYIWGAILAPDGKVYEVQVDDYIGITHARVTKVEDGQVTVAEQDATTGNYSQTTTLTVENTN